MSNKSIKDNLRTARLIASFALLGAVAAGVLFGWTDIDLRPAGAAAGAGVALLSMLKNDF